MTIDWAAFDWQSFATLATGAMAVVAAAWVGIRQAGISERQTDILNRQSNLADLSLRHDLFERRYAIYDASRRFLVAILAEAARPDREVEQQFISAMLESKLLFRSEVHTGLDAIWKRATHFYVTLAEEKRREPGASERTSAQLTAFADDLTGLVDLFGAELRLSAD